VPTIRHGLPRWSLRRFLKGARRSLSRDPSVRRVRRDMARSSASLRGHTAPCGPGSVVAAARIVIAGDSAGGNLGDCQDFCVKSHTLPARPRPSTRSQHSWTGTLARRLRETPALPACRI